MGAARAAVLDETEARYMARAMALAQKAIGETAPNPIVGCVVVKDGAIVGEGFHERAGEPHAEAAALASAGADAAGAHLYVTLEPCNHHGRTPPCAQAILDAGVASVTYAMADPNKEASGGADTLRTAGVDIHWAEGFDTQAKEMNRPWLSRVLRQRPIVIGKMAMSLDGRIATRAGESQWITGREARAHAHKIRRSVDAIIVGAETVMADDPALTARLGADVVGRPLRVVFDTLARTSPGAAVYDRSGRGALLLTTRRAPAARLAAFSRYGVDVAMIDTDENGRPDAAAALDLLYYRGANAILVEGGAALHASFLARSLYDEIHAYLAPMLIGGDGRPALEAMAFDRLGDVISGAFAAPLPLGDDLLLTAQISAFARNFKGDA